MKARPIVPFAALCLSVGLSAQVLPQRLDDNPRLQTVRYASEQEVMLTMLPGTPLTVVLERGDPILDVTPGYESGFSIRVSAERDSFTILPVEPDASGPLQLSTQRRAYRFFLRVEQDATAALIVEYEYGQRAHVPPKELAASDDTWLYRMRGDRSVRPASISDDGIKTRIRYAPGQALPAVFAIGPSGDEEVVNGYMRGEEFVIDRVYSELVFRIDKEKATAQRNDEPEDDT